MYIVTLFFLNVPLFSFRTQKARMERKFRLFCVFNVQFILTTDIGDLFARLIKLKQVKDVNHERKRAYLLNLCNLCSFTFNKIIY